MSTHALPSGSTRTDLFAQALGRLLGPAYSAPDGSANADDLRALGGLLAGVYATLGRAVDQAHPATVTDLLDEWEDEYGLPRVAGLSTSERQTRLLAKTRALFEGTPNTIRTAVRTFDATAAIVENEIRTVQHTRVTAVFQFAVTVALATWTSEYLRGRVVATVQQMKPAYTRARVAPRSGFRCDDTDSRCDRDLLGS